MSLRVSDYDYELPGELIAQYPPPKRDASRLLVVDRRARSLGHHSFTELPRLIDPEDLLVLNNTEVIPARVRLPDRNAELLLLEQQGPARWRCWVRPGRWFSPGREFKLPGLSGRVLAIEENGDRIVEFDRPPDLEVIGEMPLPPYVQRPATAADYERYQTVYAAERGAVAAPTAGLHFTREMLAGLPHAFITLHVGPGTFRPVKAEAITEHQMHREPFHVGAEAAAAINRARKVLAVGTTSVRVVETLMARYGEVRAGPGDTDLFIYPPYRFRRVDKLLTNFHLPKSTLLMLVAAFAGRDFILEAYREAVRARYRFFSYGDAMLII